MNNDLHASFKIYVDPQNHQKDTDSKASGVGGPDPNAMDGFFKEVDNVKEDIKEMETFYNSLIKSNEEMKTALNAKDMMELRTQTNTDLDNVVKMAKQISKKLDGLVVANAAQRKTPGNESGSPNDQKRASIVSELIENLMNMMRGFQGLRVRMETDQRQIMDNRYYSITGEKATEEAIDNLIANEGHEALLFHAMQEHGSGEVLDTIAEIQERRDAMKDIRKSLLNLHQILSGMATSIEAPTPSASTGGLPNPTEPQSRPLMATTNATPFPIGKMGGAGKLNDYEKETRRQAYVAMAIAIVCSIIIISLYIKTETDEATEKWVDPRSGLTFV